MPTPSANYQPLTPLSFLKRAAYVFRDKTAVVYGDKRYTWQEFAGRANRLSHALKKAGIKKGDKVAFLCRNLPQLLEAHYAIPQIGAVLVALNVRLSPREIVYIGNHSEAKALFVESTLAELVESDKLPGIKMFINIPEGETSRRLSEVDYEDFLMTGKEDPVKYNLDDENDPIAINYTSGTTGPPKGCVATHRTAYLQALGKTIELGLDVYSVYLWTLPMFHCNGWARAWSVACRGSTSVCMTRPDPPEIYRLVEGEGVTHMDGAPIVWVRLNQYMEENDLWFSHRVRINNGGSAPSPRMIRSLDSRGAEIIHNYGLTETLDGFTVCEWQPQWDVLSAEERARIKGRQGVVNVTAGEMRVVDAEMRDVPADGITIGEIVLRGNALMKEYFKQPEETATAFRGGWFHTGDGVVVHPDGYVEIKDRFKDIIISGGENISSIEVENVICEHPDVLEAACFGMKDEKWGEAVKAIVTPKPGTNPTAEEIISFCRQRIAHYKSPKVIEFGVIPRGPTGKIQKYILRKQLMPSTDEGK
ncbi:MAG: AMP-binding protein [Dehalococcoidales bacterium]|nr:AMP-binding protein [Dehalococcoidales bacterium]